MFAAAVNVPWYLSRATGLVAYLLLFSTVVLGISIRTKGLDKLVARWRVTDLHGFLSVLVIFFVLFHAGVLLLDSFMGFKASQILIPFTAPYRSIWTSFGIISAYALIVVSLSFLVRRWIGYRAWRTLHYSNFIIYLGALVHGIFSGTDSPTLWADAIYIVTGGIVLSLVIYRVAVWSRSETRRAENAHAKAKRERSRWQSPAPASAYIAEYELQDTRNRISSRARAFGFASVGTAAIVLIAAAVGPFKWFSGTPTPTDSITGATTDATGPAVDAPNPGGNGSTAAGFSDQFSGTVTTNQTDRGRGTVGLHLQAQGQRNADLEMSFDVVVFGREEQVISSTATLTDASGSQLCSGSVTEMDDQNFAVTCDGAGPYAGRTVLIQGSIDNETDTTLSGSLSVQVES